MDNRFFEQPILNSPYEADRALQALEKLNSRSEVRVIRQVTTILGETGGE